MTKKASNSIDIFVGSRVRMGRQMLRMSQGKLGDALGISFQQVQKYEKGINRIGAGRLLHIAQILRVPVTFLFEGVPDQSTANGNAISPNQISDFLATSDGIALVKAFIGLKDAKLRRCIVRLAEEIGSDHN